MKSVACQVAKHVSSIMYYYTTYTIVMRSVLKHSQKPVPVEAAVSVVVSYLNRVRQTRRRMSPQD